MDARIRSTSSYGATGVMSPQFFIVIEPPRVEGRGHSDRRQQVAHDGHVGDGRHIRQVILAVGEQRRGHQLEHRVLCAGYDDFAVQGRGASNNNPVGIHRPSMAQPHTALAIGPGKAGRSSCRERCRQPPVASWRVPPRTDVAPVVAGRHTRGAARPDAAGRPRRRSSRLDRWARRRRSRSAMARSRRTSARSSTGPTTVDETIRYRIVIPVLRLAVCASAARHAAPPTARRHVSVVVAARPPDATSRRHVRVCSPRHRWPPRSPTRCSPRPPVSPPMASASTSEPRVSAA